MIALQLFRESYLVLPGLTVMDAKALQFENGLVPMLVTELGISMESNPEQDCKA
jgi:hypothetical protein